MVKCCYFQNISGNLVCLFFILRLFQRLYNETVVLLLMSTNFRISSRWWYFLLRQLQDRKVWKKKGTKVLYIIMEHGKKLQILRMRTLSNSIDLFLYIFRNCICFTSKMHFHLLILIVFWERKFNLKIAVRNVQNRQI